MAFSCADWLLLVAFIIILAFILAVWRNAYFVRRGIKIQRQPLPFFGHMKEVFFNKEHLVHTLYKVYNENYGQRYTGFFAYFTPAVMFLDLDLIKQIGVKDFDHFVDHKVFLDEEAEPLLGCNMFFLRGQKWRDMRSALSPAYTSSKMKSIFPLVVDCALQTRDFISKSITQLEGGDVLEIEIKDMLTRYTNDVIASTAFGFKINSFEDRTNEFFIMGEKATNFSGWQFLKFQGYAICPSVMKFFKLALFPSDVATYYRKLVHQTIASRESSGVSRPDMVQLLMQAKKGALQYDTDHTQGDDSRFSNVQGVSGVTKPEVVKREWSDDEITAQAVAFMIAGFGTPSSMLCFIAYELARNPDVQKKLQEEIDEVYTRTNGQPSYADLSNMKYIDMVISETLRLWPPDGLLERVCVKPYTLPPQNNSSSRTLHMGVGDECIIPIFAIHHNPDYFPDPEKFDPERFSDENKSLIKPFTYIPFGVGPRLCIGARFALMEAKALWFHISAHFDVIVTKKTTIPFTLATDTFNMHPKFGLWLGLKARNVHPLH